jgi:hypothetical protein
MSWNELSPNDTRSCRGFGPPGAGGANLLGILRHEGMRALWVGAGPRVARRTVQMAMTWAMYEELMLMIQRQDASLGGMLSR